MAEREVPHRRLRRRLAAALAVLLLPAPGCDELPTAPAPDQVTTGEVIAALFLGEGRAKGSRGVGCTFAAEGIWNSYAAGDSVRVVIASSVGEEDRRAIETEVDQFAAAAGGYFSLSVASTADPDPRPGPFEITIAEVDAQRQAAECGFAGTGCPLCSAAAFPRMDSCRVLVRDDLTFAPGTVHVHELGHALGMCHVAGVSLPQALMGSPQRGSANAFTGEELTAIAAVYGSGLEPGATTADFIEAGLIPLTGKD